MGHELAYTIARRCGSQLLESGGHIELIYNITAGMSTITGLLGSCTWSHLDSVLTTLTNGSSGPIEGSFVPVFSLEATSIFTIR